MTLKHQKKLLEQQYDSSAKLSLQYYTAYIPCRGEIEAQVSYMPV